MPDDPQPVRPAGLGRRARRVVGQAVDRLPVGRATARRIGREIARRIDRTRPAGSGTRRDAIPRHFQVIPKPPPIAPGWPDAPEGMAEPEVPAAAPGRVASTAPPHLIYDVELFEALNAEYASKPVVPIARANDPHGMVERGARRLGNIHASIDLADKRVLEFGCGRGYEVWLLSHHLGSDAHGIDVVEAPSWAKLADERTHFVKADIALDRPFPADHFDRIISSSVFEHVRHPAASLAELHRVLRPGGLAWISANLYRGPVASHRYRDVFFPFPHLLFEDEVFRQFYTRRGDPPNTASWVNRLSWADYEELFERTGFRLRSLRFSERELDEAFYERFDDILSRYPRTDLTRDFFHVVAEKVARRRWWPAG